MPIIYRATKAFLNSINYGIALATGDKGYSDMASDFFGHVVSSAIGDGVNQLNYSQDVYWSAYADLPKLGNVYSLPSIVTSGTRMYTFYQGQAPYTTDAGTGGYLYYSSRACGAVLSDQLCALNFPDPDVPIEQGLQPSPPVGVLFGDKVYAFYGSATVGPTGQIYYAVYDENTWSSPQPVPGVSIFLNDGDTAPVTPVVFTPPGSQSPQLYLFYPMALNLMESAQLDIACVATEDGKTWTAIAPGGLGIPELWDSCISATVYAPPGAASEQIYLFYVSGSTLSYVTYPDANGGASAPVAITAPSTFTDSNGATVYTSNDINGAVVYTPPDATTPLLYFFVSQTIYPTGLYSDYVPEDQLSNYNATETTTFEYPLQTIFYTTFDGSTWSEYEQVPNATWSSQFSSPLPSAAVLPPASFSDNMSPVTDIYLSTVQSAQPGGEGSPTFPGTYTCAAFVGSLNQYDAGTAPSQVTSFPPLSTSIYYVLFAGVCNASLLAVDLPGFAAPQPWLFYSTFNQTAYAYQMQYAVYTGSGWTGYSLPPIVVEVPDSPQMIGSPAILPVPTGNPSQTWQSLTVFNSTDGMQGYTSYYAPGGGQFVTSISVVPEATGSPSLALLNNEVYLFYQGAGSQAGQLWYTQSSMLAYGEGSTPVAIKGVAMSESPSAVVFDGDLYVFFQGANDNGQLWYVCLSGTSGTWSAPVQVVPTGEDATSELLSGTPSACLYTPASGSSQLFVAYAGAGTSGSWQLTYCLLGTDGAWAQAIVPDVLIADSPTAYAVTAEAYDNTDTGSPAGRLNIFFQPASSPGGLYYCVYNGSTWSPVGTTPITTLDGWVSGIMYQGENEALLYLLHNNSGTNAGQLSFCQCTVATQAQGGYQTPDGSGQQLKDGLLNVGVGNGTESYMTGAPAATVANGNIYVFFNSNYQTEYSSYVSGALGYMQIPLPANSEQALGTYPANLVNGTETLPDAYDVTNSAVTGLVMANSPAAATFQNTPYVFFNTGNGAIAYCAGLASTPQTAASSVASACNPAVIAGTTTAPVTNAAGDNSIDVLYLFYIGSTTQQTHNGETYEVGTLLCCYTTNGVSWSDLDLGPSPSVNSNGVMLTKVDGQVYLFYSTLGVRYYTIFPGLDCVGGAAALATPTRISRMACSTGPSLATFNNNLWCVTQGIDETNYTARGGWAVTPNECLFFSRTLDGKSWSWNTNIDQVNGAPTTSTARPVATAFTPSSGSELLYVFWPTADGGYLEYATTDGTYVTPTSSAYGLPWSGPYQVGSDAHTDDNFAVSVIPPLDSPTDPDQLYAFWQGSNHSGILYYASMSTSGDWSPSSEIMPVGCNGAYMSLSPSVVSYAPEGGTPTTYVFYQKNGSSGKQQGKVDLQYCVYSDGKWTQSQVPNISYTTQAMEGIPQETYTGIDAATPPAAIVFNGKLYVFYIQDTYQWSNENRSWSNLYPVTYSVFDGTTWSDPNRIGPTSTVDQNTSPFTFSQVPQFVSASILNGDLYVFFMNVGAIDVECPPPGSIFYVSTSDGMNWSSPATTTNVVYVPAGMTTLEGNLGTEINDSLADVNGALSFVGLPTSDEIRNSVAAGAIGVFF
ncbi:hypothetical protein [Pseudoxanthomonas sp. UTMC 1351]|uniref:hypothetical protein n=1 Tax=Pseudoxanthomonas sp. UTMC 1351 TaxID=2695853 RepID=UPI0034CD90AC